MNYPMKYHSMTTKRAILITVIAFASLCLKAESVLDMPVPKQFVNDYADLLSVSQEQKLEKRIAEFSKNTSTQVAIATVNSLEGYTSADYAHRLANKWGVGQKGKDNGILILIKPKYSHEKGEVYIAVGYGLEKAIPDRKAKQIIETVLIPDFKRNRFYDGLNESLNVLFQLTQEEYKPDFVNRPFMYIKRDYVVALGIFTLLLPFLYLSYLKRRIVPESYSHYYIIGAYNANNVISQIERIEKAYNKTFPKFKKHILKYEQVTRNNLMKYSDKIDRKMFCVLLNGRKRFSVFFELADPFLKGICSYLILLFLLISIGVLLQYNAFAFLVSLFISFLLIYAMIGFLTSFLEIFQFTLRKKAAYVGGVSLALFAINAVFKKNIKKKFDTSTGTYYYYPAVIYAYNGGSYGGGYSGASFGAGGFGGGGFGGGGAGGSW